MTKAEFIQAAFLRATGKTNTLTSGTKYDRILALGNLYIDEWSNEPGVDWASLYDPAFSLGTVTATDSFDIDTSSVRKLSDRQGDKVRIIWSDGTGYTDYDIVAADTLSGRSYGVNRQSPAGFYCAKIGNQLVFNHTFTSDDSQYGGEIFIPCYTYPDHLENADDEVPVDIPNWLVVMVAAEYVRNDITRRARYPELLAEANSIMGRMKDDQEGQVVEITAPWTPFTGSDDPWGS